MEATPALVIPLMALLIPLVIVPVALGIRLERRKREMEHAERMRALELGRTLPQDEPWLTPPKLSLVIGGVVPVSVFGIAWLASEGGGYHEEIFLFAGLVGVAGVVCGTFLAAKSFQQPSWAEPPARDFAKAPFDADSYDVTGARG